MERKGPDYIPYSDWIVIDEKKRRKRNWLMGSVTAAGVVAIFAALMIPVVNRRALINDLAYRFARVEQVITTEERIGPNDLRFDRRVIEETDKSRRTELEEGNLILFSSEEGGSIYDRKRGTLTSFRNGDLRETPFEIIRDLLASSTKDVRTSVQKTSMSGGALKLRADEFTYVVRPGEGRLLANVDVQIDTDLGPTTLRKWQFERTTPDVAKFYAANYTKVQPKRWEPLSERPEEEIFTTLGRAYVLRVDVNDKGDVYVMDSTRYPLEYSVESADGAQYALIPTGNTYQSMERPGETQRENLAYRKRGTNLTWPLKVKIVMRPDADLDSEPAVLERTFKGPTCSVAPDYEYGPMASDYPILSHKLRSYLCEASLAETGFGLVRYANADGPIKDAVQALTFYRFAFTYFASQRGTGARTYFSIYRCYESLNQQERAISALKLAAEKNNGRDPWLDQKINEAFLREGLIEE